jgi:hypothetical protein
MLTIGYSFLDKLKVTRAFRSAVAIPLRVAHAPLKWQSRFATGPLSISLLGDAISKQHDESGLGQDRNTLTPSIFTILFIPLFPLLGLSQY